jgi:metal transporter CNNM
MSRVPPRRVPVTGVARMPLLMSLAKLASATPVLIFQNTHAVAPIEPEDPVGSTRFYFKLGFSVCLVLAGGVFAGCVIVAVHRS